MCKPAPGGELACNRRADRPKRSRILVIDPALRSLCSNLQRISMPGRSCRYAFSQQDIGPLVHHRSAACSPRGAAGELSGCAAREHVRR